MHYGSFANIADDYWKTFGPEFHELLQRRLKSLLSRYHIRPRRILDLGCGTGSFVLAWARRGFQMSGLDGSDVALQIARRKARSAHLAVNFVNGDLRQFGFSRPFDLVVSIFNTVNHILSEAALRSTFRCVAGALIPSGWFMFDLNNASCFRHVWGGVSVVDHPRFVVVRRDQIDFKRKKASAQMAIYLRQNQRFIRSEDTIRETWYSSNTIRRLASETGFRVVRAEQFNPFGHPALPSGIKTLWLLQKK